MQTRAKVLVLLLAAPFLYWAWEVVLAYNRGVVDIVVTDYGLKTDHPTSLRPQIVALRFLDADGESLASAKTGDDYSLVKAIHPDPSVADCGYGVVKNKRAYRDCFVKYTRWISRWAPRVRSAVVDIRSCHIAGVPLKVEPSIVETGPLWWMWNMITWHGASVPRRKFKVRLAVNSRTCTAEQLPSDGG